MKRSLAAAILIASMASRSDSQPKGGGMTDTIRLPEHVASNRAFKAQFLKAVDRTHGPGYPRGGTVGTTVVLWGCTPGSDGLCRVRALFRVVDPSGELYCEPSSREATDNPTEWHSTMFQVGFSIPIRQDAKTGAYTITAEVKDVVADLSVVVKQRFEVTAEDVQSRHNIRLNPPLGPSRRLPKAASAAPVCRAG